MRQKKTTGIEPQKGDSTRTFIADTPLTDPALDRFKRHPFAQRVAKTLALRGDPSSIVVLIHGSWGEGKTSVLEFIDKELQSFNYVVPVRFNPWRVTDETALLVTFFGAIATALDRPMKTIKEKIGDVFRKYGEIAGELALDIHGTKVSMGHAATKIGETLSLVTLEEERTRIEHLLQQAGIRVVVFLDDIDRLDRKEAQAVFKLLKLTANFANVSYVLAFDRDVVAKAIGEQYGAGDSRAGYDYLEKIIQVNLSLPLADREALAKLCLDLLEDAISGAGLVLTPEHEREFQLGFLQYIAPELRTPRVAKLYANAVAFALPLLANEINPVDLLLLEAVKCFHPTLHEHIRLFPSIYTGQFGWDIGKTIDGGKQAQLEIQKQLELLTAQAADRAKHLLTQLFPQLHDLLRSGKYGRGNADRAQRDQRVSVFDYLNRYLTCSIPTGDISDKEIDDYLRRVFTMTEADAADAYCGLLRQGQEYALLFKLKTRMREVPLAAGERVCLAIARNGDRLPDPQGNWSRLPAVAGFVIREFARRLSGAGRTCFATTVLSDAQPLHFAGKCFDWMQLQPNEHESERLFVATDEDRLRIVLAERIAQYATQASLLAGRPEDFIPLLHVWHAAQGGAPVRAHVGAELARSPEIAETLIIPFANVDRTGITRENYEALKKFAAPEQLIEALRARRLLDPKRKDHLAPLAQVVAALYAADVALPSKVSCEGQTTPAED